MSDNNLAIWDALKTPPSEATKEIKGGRLAGKTDINAQWRLRAMTEQFGPCGIGWRYDIVKLWAEAAGQKGEVVAFALVDVYIKEGEAWSQAIPGIGGNKLVASESGGPYVNDECFKMAVTDALSVAFKAIGVAADVYMGKFDSKYDQRGGGARGGGNRQKRTPKDMGLGVCKKCNTFLRKVTLKDGSGRWFLGCQGYPDCKYTEHPPKEGEPKAAPPAQRPATLSDAEPALVAKPAAAQEPEEMCPMCGNHPINPDGHCPNEHGAVDDAPEVYRPEQEWRPQCCGRSMMPRPSTGDEAPRWHCPKCRATRAMTDEERKRVGL